MSGDGRARGRARVRTVLTGSERRGRIPRSPRIRRVPFVASRYAPVHMTVLHMTHDTTHDSTSGGTCQVCGEAVRCDVGFDCRVG